MDRPTVAAYDAVAARYGTMRSAGEADRAEGLAERLDDGRVRLDLGCGPGLYLPHLGRPVVALDASGPMVTTARDAAPGCLGVQADLAALPLRDGAVAGVWACRSIQHLPAVRLPGALAELHRVLPVGAPIELTAFALARGAERDPLTSTRGWAETITTAAEGDDVPGRLFTQLSPDAATGLLEGAGFDVTRVRVGDQGDFPRLEVSAVRARTLADSVGPGMRLLLCGLNPSVYSADAGVGYARPGNRLWPALRAAGLSAADRDPRRLLADGIGMTDLVKRATVAAAELGPDEYAHGVDRVERLCRLLTPRAVCMVGLSGWRAAVDRSAAAGWQPGGLGGTPVYVMPSTSGLNAHARPADLAGHLARAATGPPA